jgi:hypothetical protein
MLKKLWTAIICFSMTSCATLVSVSQTQIPAKRNNVITAEANKWIFLLLSFDNDYASEVSTKLANQCRGGEVRGILTKDENFNYFLGLVTQRRITAKGYCLSSKG